MEIREVRGIRDRTLLYERIATIGFYYVVTFVGSAYLLDFYGASSFVRGWAATALVAPLLISLLVAYGLLLWSLWKNRGQQHEPIRWADVSEDTKATIKRAWLFKLLALTFGLGIMAFWRFWGW